MDLNKNYYEILGIDKNASKEDIKKQFKKLALKYHPDKNSGDKTSEEKFKEINEANSILTGDKKEQYDMMSPHGANYNPNARFGGFSNGGFSNGFGFSNFGFSEDGFPETGDPWMDEVLRQHFGARARRTSTVREDLDIGLVINVDISDTYKNKTIPIRYNKNVKCDACKGTGFNMSSSSEICDACGGKGKDGYGITCIKCGGTGKIYDEQCSKCKGERIISTEMKFYINNTYKIESDIDNVYRGQGHQSKYYNKAGNLHTHINFINNSNYIRTRQGLLSHLNIHYQDAIDGFTYKHKHLDDTTLLIKIPAGTKDNDLIRVPKKGMLMDGVNREPLLFRINIVIDYDRVKKKRK